MSIYQMMADAAKRHPEHSFLEVWYDFSCWERVRNYADDPNAASKEDIEWIQSLYGLYVQLKTRSGDTQDCRNALEAAAAAFALLPHEPQMCRAVATWYQRQQQEWSQE